MQRIGLVWDLGAGFGHVRKLTALAERLVARGHDVLFVSRNLRSFLSHWNGPRYPLLQAPHNDWFCDEHAPASYADILWSECGLHDALQFQALARAWRELIPRLHLHRLVVEASPIAILATAGLDLPRIAMGSGFLLPPPGPPWRAFRDWEAVDTRRLATREQQIAERIAQWRFAHGLPGADAREALRADAEAVITHALFDHYPDRGTAQYFAPVMEPGAALPPALRDRRFVFAYLSAGFPNVDAVVAALVAQGDPALLVVPGMAERDIGDVVIRGRGVDARTALAQATMVLCQGGNLLQQAVAAGRPVLALPTQAEQALTARRLVQLEAGLMLDARSDVSGIARALRQLHDDARFAAGAQAAAQRMAQAAPGDIDALADFVLQAR